MLKSSDHWQIVSKMQMTTKSHFKSRFSSLWRGIDALKHSRLLIFKVKLNIAALFFFFRLTCPFEIWNWAQISPEHHKWTFFRLNLAVFISYVLYINIYVRICAVKVCFVSALMSQKKKLKITSGTGSNTHSEVNFLSGSSPTLTIGRFVFLFPEVGICAKFCGASAYFLNEQYLCTTVRKIGKPLTECSVIPGDSPELLTASMCQLRFPDHTHKSSNS